jgi:Domain of unknown function (DUF1996)
VTTRTRRRVHARVALVPVALVPVALVLVAVAGLLAGCAVGGTDRAGGTDGAGGHEAHAAHPDPAERAGPLAPARHVGPQGRVGQLVTECGHSHTAPDDPILLPGQPGQSHQHDFFGNVSTDADSTLDTLLDEATTCQHRQDTAAYWAPQLLDHDVAVTPVGSVAYYRAAPGVDPTRLEPYPPGLAVVAGDMTATEPLSPDLAGWACGVSSRHSAAPPECPESAPLRAVITFPDCWDGERTDSPDHAGHMANSDGGVCPGSHPVHVPQLTFAVLYPIAGPGHELRLASGSTYGVHADFLNAWDQPALAAEIRHCLHRDLVCGLASNRGEEPLFAHG